MVILGVPTESFSTFINSVVNHSERQIFISKMTAAFA